MEVTSGIAALKTLLAVKSASSIILGPIVRFFTPSRLVIEIDAALKNDPQVIQPSPHLIRDRITDATAEQLVIKAFTCNESEFGEYLTNEQIVHLPIYPSTRPQDWNAVWNCVAQTVQRGVLKAVIADEPLFRQFMVLSQQHGFNKITAQIAALTDSTDGQEKQLSETPCPSQGNQEPRSVVVDLVVTAKLEKQLLDQVELLEDRLMQELDEKVKRLWDEVIFQIEQHNFRDAIRKGEELKRTVESDKRQLSSVALGRTYLLLAQVALIESHEQNELSEDCGTAKQLFEKAKDTFGAEVSEENRQRIANFRAKLLAIGGNNAEAIDTIGDAKDAQSITTRLLIYIDMGAHFEAVESIRGEQPDEKWCEFAAFATQRIGDNEHADRLLNWAIDKGCRELENRCRLAIAKASLIQAEESCGANTLTPLSITEKARQQVSRAEATLSPLATRCISSECVQSGVDADAVAYVYECHRLLGDQAQSLSHAKLLNERRPTHFGYAKAMIRGHVEYDSELPGRLRDDYPAHFMAHDFALTLELQSQPELNDVIGRVERLGKLATTSIRKEKVAKSVFQIATGSPTDQLLELRDIAVRLVGERHFAVQAIDAYRWLREGDLENFKLAVEKIECDDYLKNQFRAQLLTAKGKYGEASMILLESAKHICEPGLLRDSALLAMQAKPPRLDIALNALESAAAIDERHPETNQLLADVYLRLHAYASAANCFARLRIQSNDWRFVLNQAVCYVLANQPNNALPIFDDLCQRPTAPLKAHLARSKLLTDTGKPRLALTLLNEIREQFWSTPEFLLAYTHVAYASGDDKSASRSFEQLLKLRSKGLVSENLVKAGTTDDLISLNAEAEDRRNFLLDKSLAGKLPWTFCERLLGNASYWGWRIRTQPTRWFYDDARGRSSHSIYSTNGYAVVKNEANQPQVTRLSCPPKGSAVVADLSALITLKQLGILDVALSYFGQVNIPPSYSAKFGREIGELQPTQLSVKHNLQAIKSMVDERQIKVVENVGNARVVDEYCKENDSNVLRVVDLLNALQKLGKIGVNQLQEAMLVANKPAALESNDKIETRTSLVIKGQTIRTIAGQGLLGVLCETFGISILDADFIAVIGELRMFEKLEETKQWNIELWEHLKNDDRVHHDTFVIPPPDLLKSESEDSESIDADDQSITAIDASLLAQQELLPLLVDDRVCHSIIYQQNSDSASTAFSTDILIEGLVTQRMIDVLTAAKAYLKLMRWRYRFLVVPSKILLTVAKEFATIDLRVIAEYVHDCMRDPGLFGGPEVAQPPIPIAFRFHQDWLQNIAIFSADVWLDAEIDDDSAGVLTDWAMRELIPSPPLTMGSRADAIVEFTPSMILVHSMMRLSQIQDHRRTNRILRRIAHGLDLTDKEFIRITTDIIDRND